MFLEWYPKYTAEGKDTNWVLFASDWNAHVLIDLEENQYTNAADIPVLFKTAAQLKSYANCIIDAAQVRKGRAISAAQRRMDQFLPGAQPGGSAAPAAAGEIHLCVDYLLVWLC
jgi:hypothetical protein